jgi:hypothetical protein
MSLDPCRVLTQSDVEAVVGETSERKPRARTSPTLSSKMTSVVCTHKTPGWTIGLERARYYRLRLR